MPLNFKKGDLFTEPAEALVNTVNCVGIMGKGVALEFKKRWPDNFKHYKQLCDKQGLRPGTLYVHPVGDMYSVNGTKFIINFPTKDHWRARSKIEFIEKGLDALADALVKHNISSVALPPLGCGNGGLSWDEVKPLILKKLSNLDGINVTVLESTARAAKLEHRPAGVLMTYPRAVLLKTLGDLEALFDGLFDRISMQKIVYLLQALGVPFRLSFKRNLFGPYSENLRRAFVGLEKAEMLEGFTSPERLTNVTPAGYAIADEYLDKSSQGDLAHDTVHKLSKLIDGYEGPYGLELLSSVHHLAMNENIRDVDDIVEEMARWNDSKRNRFSPSVIRGAFVRLKQDGLLPH